MKLLVTGSKGQLGTELIRQAAGHHDTIAVDVAELDITDDTAVTTLMQSTHPDIVINAAAYTAVDRAEDDVANAFAVNADGPKHLAIACQQAGIPLIHVSTDYVFDGTKQAAYSEDDAVAPLAVYGQSKLQGEQAVQQYCQRHIILRTSWVVSSHGHNFVKTMLRLGAEREELAVVADQRGCPTAASELARGILHIIERSSITWGVYHFCQPEATTWHAFATAIFAEARQQNLPMKIKDIKAITTRDYPTPAKRPANSVMECTAFESTFNMSIRPWKESLANIIGELTRMSSDSR